MSLKTENQELHERIRNLENQNQEQLKRIQSLEHENQDLRERMEKSSDRNQHLQETIQILSGRIKCHLEEQLKEQEELRSHHKLLEETLMRCDERVDVCPHLRELKEERRKHANLKEELEELRTVVDDTGSREMFIKSYKKNMSADLKRVENRLSEERKETERQRQRNKELSEEMEILYDELQKIEQENTGLQGQIQQMREELQKAHAELESSTKTLAEEQRRKQLLTPLEEKYELHDEEEEDEDKSK
ncbi:M protein, serotype 2.1-like [Boleophthalmus pectinirostris]|uniref:M protein, serotype 2.1-like n=1 Tax=Boleophthalmus pectinirostris TaxID=150288 RepID=UPI002432EF8C|nr:M protein, serotype 2.1-like [Boleophthalmus pectinirostris]